MAQWQLMILPHGNPQLVNFLDLNILKKKNLN